LQSGHLFKSVDPVISFQKKFFPESYNYQRTETAKILEGIGQKQELDQITLYLFYVLSFTVLGGGRVVQKMKEELYAPSTSVERKEQLCWPQGNIFFIIYCRDKTTSPNEH
jgi:hypothetical protein